MIKRIFQYAILQKWHYSRVSGKWPQNFIKWGFANSEDRSVKNFFLKSLQKLVPGIKYEDIEAGGSGIRAQALEPDGKLVDDFRIVEAAGMIHVLNAPSPAATASLSIGKKISQMVLNRFNTEIA